MTPLDRCSICGGELAPDETTEICSACRESPETESVNNEPASAFAPTIRQTGGFVPPAPEALDRLFSQLEVLELLGHGGMGAVYKARQTKLDRLVALKIILPETAGEASFQERFQREARLLARLNHPGIVGIHDFGEVERSQNLSESGEVWFYFVMEYVAGANLRAKMEKPLPSDQALSIIRQVCEALEYAHGEGVIHRDIKPENILIDSRGRVKIADFGLAKFTARESGEHSLTGTHQVMGTPRYMAPEQLQGSKTVDHRADIYALGVVFYEMFTGELPLGRFDPPAQKATIDPAWDRIVLKMLEQSPERRYQSVSELLRDLRALTPTSREFAPAQSLLQGPTDSDTVLMATSFHEAAPEVARRVKWPGIALIVNGFLFLLPAAMLFISGIVGLSHPSYPEQRTMVAILLMACSLLTLFAAGVVVRGGWHLLTLDQYRPALLASFIGQPAGIWGLSVLSRPEVRSGFQTEDRPLGISRFLLTPLPWIALLALVGIVEAFLPWASIVKPSGIPMLDGLISPPTLAYASGFSWWQGMTVCLLFGAILLIVVFSAGLKPAPLARPIVLSLLAAAILASAGHFVMELRNGSLPVQPLLSAAGWSIERNGIRPSTAREAGVVPSLTSAPELISILTAGLFVLIAIDLRRALQARQKIES